MKLIVGLGNPGSLYSHTRHNVGFMVLDKLAASVPCRDLGRRWHGVVAIFSAYPEPVYLLKPQTYMNASGRAVAAAVQDLAISLADILVVFDDLALPLGTLRFREKGSGGGQKGMQSIVDKLGIGIPRLRLGIGANTDLMPRDFVLQPFTPQQMLIADAMISRAAEAVMVWVEQGMVQAMNRFNGPVE